ncbi:putative transcriptional regulator [Bradyrhizobium sp. LB14.3]
MSVYLDPDVMKTLSAYAVRREQSMSLIAEAAIASFLSPDVDERREAAIAKRLDQVDRRIARLERDTGISVETLALFVRFRLTTTPPLPEPAAKAARAQGSARWDSFVTALGRRLSQGPNLRQSRRIPRRASRREGASTSQMIACRVDENPAAVAIQDRARPMRND